MPWIKPTVFVTNNILMAGQLNALADDVEYINSLTDYVNVPFSKYLYGKIGFQDMGEARWVVRHRHRYLHFKITVESGVLHAPFGIAVDWGVGTYVPVTQTNDMGPGSLSSVGLGAIDLQALGVPDQAFLTMWWYSEARGRATAHYFYESNLAVL